MENYRKGSLAKLGLDYESLRQRKPNLIYASLNAYGYDGPWSERPGWEQLAQATSGMQVRQGGRDDAPMLMPYPVNDYGTGMMGAYAVALAIHERNRTGKGQPVDSGLALTAGLLQSPFFLNFDGHQRNEPEGRGLRGISAFSRLYQASDGWFYLHCRDPYAIKNLFELEEFAHLENKPEVAKTGEGQPGQNSEIAQELAKVFTMKSCSHWVARLTGAGIAATENMGIADFRDANHVRESGLIVTRDHPGQGSADHLGSTAHLFETPMRVGRPTPILGTDAEEILAEAGLTKERIARLEANGVVVAR